MRIEESKLPGVFRVFPDRFGDDRGVFFEGYRADLLREATKTPFEARQVNYSVSRRNTLRGIHGVGSPPGQAKYVTCVRGALLDIVVDLRVGSPTFGEHTSTVLDAGEGTAVYIPDGMGHGFQALADDSCICYLLSTTHVPGTQYEIFPLDPELALPWELTEEPVMSEKDASAQSLAQALSAGILSPWTGEAAK